VETDPFREEVTPATAGASVMVPDTAALGSTLSVGIFAERLLRLFGDVGSVVVVLS
jgi:hypothetical protein